MILAAAKRKRTAEALNVRYSNGRLDVDFALLAGYQQDF